VERSKRSRPGATPSRIAPQSRAALANIAELIDSGGQITIGAIEPVECAAIANDEHDCLAMLRRKPGETLQELLARLDAAIELAWKTEQFTDEINTPPQKKSR
jgi:hypothetical protein